MADFGKNRQANERPKRQPDHDRIIRGIPFFGNAEGPCPGPVDAREWTPEPSERYPSGDWEAVNFLTGNADDRHGGAIRCWVHSVYLKRCRDSRYLADTETRGKF